MELSVIYVNNIYHYIIACNQQLKYTVIYITKYFKNNAVCVCVCVLKLDIAKGPKGEGETPLGEERS